MMGMVPTKLSGICCAISLQNVVLFPRITKPFAALGQETEAKLVN